MQCKIRFSILDISTQGDHGHDICRKIEIYPQAGRYVAGTAGGEARSIQTGGYEQNEKLKSDWELMMRYAPKVIYYAHANKKIL